jgi:hypothetical protein
VAAKRHCDYHGFDHVAHVVIPRPEENKYDKISFAETERAREWYMYHPANIEADMYFKFEMEMDQGFLWCAFETIPEYHILDSEEEKWKGSVDPA